MRNRIRQCFVCLVVFTALFSCSKKDTSVPVSEVKLSKVEYSLEVGGILPLVATVLPANAVNKTVSWISSDPEVASVELLNANGVLTGMVTAIKKGDVIITATTVSGKKVATCVLTVVDKKIAVTAININEEIDYVYKGESLELKAEIIPGNATNQKIIWSSSKTDVATIDENGLISGVKAGVTEIKATIGEITDKWSITVKVHVESVLIEPKTGTVLVGKTLKINASVLPDNATNPTLEWKSFSPSLASVNKDGIVTGIKAAHEVKITATSKEGGKAATFIIDVAAPIVISDPAFKAKLLELKIDKDKNGEIDTYEASLVTKLELHNEADGGYSEIKNLDGIEYFVNLDTLICQKTRLEYLELEAEDLENSSLGNPKLKVLDLKGSTFIKTLSCIDLQLTYLKITGFNDLEKLECIGNLCTDFVINKGEPDVINGNPTDNVIHDLSNLKSINFSNCLGIKELVIRSTGITKINLKGCFNLDHFDCVSNPNLKSIDLSDCTKLNYINISRNDLSSLTLGECNNLSYLDCRYNIFEEIDISSCPNLNEFDCTNPDNKDKEALLKTIYVCPSFAKEDFKICRIPTNVIIMKK